MPHSNHDSAGSSDTFDLTGPMTPTAHYLNDAGVGRAISPNNQIPRQPSSLQSDAWKRRSMPNTGVYAEYIDRSDLDELLALHAARSNRNPQTVDGTHSASRRSSYHEDQQLQYINGAMAAAKDRAQRESPIIAELRTNVIVKDEFTLVTDLSHHLAQRYARSDSAIMVKVDHSACIALGGSFDPCYIMTVTNIASQMGPAMNKRNAALIQSFMSDILSVPPDRGIVQFHAIAEQDLAINGTTIQGEIERQEKQQLENGGGATTRRYSTTTNGRRNPPSLKKTNPRLDTAPNGNLYPHDNISTPSLSPTVTITPANVFDTHPIPAPSPARPTTAHANSLTKGEDGLRMHPVLPSDMPSLKDSRLPNGRPKTISASTPVPPQQSELQHQHRLASLPQRKSFSSSSSSASRPSQPLSFLKSDPARSPTLPASSLPSSSDNAAASRSRRRDSYYGSSLDPPKTSGGMGVGRRSGEGAGKPLEANTAKRRSTITATPRLPQSRAAEEEMPGSKAEAKAGVASSAKSLKVSKRKSFLAAFRRGG